MCGIVGSFVFHRSNFSVSEPYITRMRDTMAHRGPDGASTWISDDGRIGLGHRRLSIIDLSDAAGQPMCNENGTLWISYNGEIYNHASIRAELEKKGGHRWKTDHSDTEVILHAFEEWGIDCLEKFRGMFAFALWDVRERELWLVRDRIGIKPIYYSIHHGRITFASEIKALLKDPDQKCSLNEESFYHYLSFLTSPPPNTMFDGIQKLPGGYWLRVKESGEIRKERYWDVWDHTDPLNGSSEDEIAERIQWKLQESVHLRKVSDVPVGVFLSGGIDSSTNAAMFSQGEHDPVKTFTVGYDQEYQTYQNELEEARFMAKEIQAEHHEIILNVDDLIQFLPQMIHIQDEPLGDPVCVPLYYVSKLARDKGVTVCQVGEGADELYWGYPSWKRALSLQHWDNVPFPRSFKILGLTGLEVLGKKETSYYEWLRRGSIGQPVFWGGTDAITESNKKLLLSPRLRKRFSNFSSWEALQPIYHSYEKNAWQKSPLQWMSYVDLCLRLPELMLMRVDKMSMAVGLEGRVPFLDHKFVELSMSIPESIKTNNGSLKYILKKAVHGIIPDTLINRPKQGFHVPVDEWYFGKFGMDINKILKRFCEQSDLLDFHQSMRMINKGRGTLAWYLLNFAMWWERHIA